MGADGDVVVVPNVVVPVFMNPSVVVVSAAGGFASVVVVVAAGLLHCARTQEASQTISRSTMKKKGPSSKIMLSDGKERNCDGDDYFKEC